jgi:glutamate 5-kinase
MNRFPLGKIVVTPSALAALESAGETALPYLVRHARGEWGELNSVDIKANEAALKEGSKIISTYTLSSGQQIRLITEADRNRTTVLLPHECGRTETQGQLEE